MSDVTTFIENLGGGTEVASGLTKLLPKGEKPVDREAVYKWKEAGRIPYRWRPLIAQLARDRAVEVPPDVAAYAPAKPAEPSSQPKRSKRAQ